MKTDDISNYEEHKKNILNWEEEFKYNLSHNISKKMELFLIDKIWFEDYKRAVFLDKLNIETKIYNYKYFQPIDNSNIILHEKTINPDANFVVLNEESYNSFYELINENSIYTIKIKSQFINKKMITKIGNNLFYFYYLNKNDLIQEGFFIFGEIEKSKKQKILDNFIYNNINDFIYYYFNNINPNLNKNKKAICYHLKEFDLIFKINTNKNEKSDYKNLKNSINASLDDNKESESDIKIMNITKINNSKIKKKIKDKNNNNDNFRFYSPSNNLLKKSRNYFESVSNIFSFNKSQYSEIENKNNYKINKIVDCIYEYYYSQNEYKSFINASNKINKIFIPIHKDWINEFLIKCSYIQIKNILLNQNLIYILKK